MHVTITEQRHPIRFKYVESGKLRLTVSALQFWGIGILHQPSNLTILFIKLIS